MQNSASTRYAISSQKRPIQDASAEPLGKATVMQRDKVVQTDVRLRLSSFLQSLPTMIKTITSDCQVEVIDYVFQEFNQASYPYELIFTKPKKKGKNETFEDWSNFADDQSGAKQSHPVQKEEEKQNLM